MGASRNNSRSTSRVQGEEEEEEEEADEEEEEKKEEEKEKSKNPNQRFGKKSMSARLGPSWSCFEGVLSRLGGVLRAF